MRRVVKLLPELSENEIIYVEELTREMNDEDAALFSNLYRSKRKDPQMILLLTLLGFVGVAGIQRIILDQVVMGLLYLITAGLCFIGTIYDLISYKELTFEFNKRVAREVYTMVKAK